MPAVKEETFRNKKKKQAVGFSYYQLNFKRVTCEISIHELNSFKQLNWFR